MTVRELIQQARIDRVEAEILLADILEVERAWLFAHGEDLQSQRSPFCGSCRGAAKR